MRRSVSEARLPLGLVDHLINAERIHFEQVVEDVE